MAWILTALILVAVSTATLGLANCPNGCNCDDDTLVVHCEDTSDNNVKKLGVLPIALNPSIQRLVIRNNKIKSIDSSIMFYADLNYLDLSYNHLVNIPIKSFDNQKKLQELHLNHNKISSVSNWTFTGLTSLTVLNLRGNFLEELSSSIFSSLPRLEELNLGQNRISHLDPTAFSGLVSLRVLYLDDNQLNSIPTRSFATLGSLAELHVGLNAFTVLSDDAFAGLNRLSVLDLNGAGLINISEGSFRGLIGLRSLDLSDNRLKSIPTIQLSELVRLEDLVIGQNDFVFLEKHSFKGMTNLRKLDITGSSQLEIVEKDAFADNLNMETLILSSNKKLTTIEEGTLVGLPNLRHLILRENAFVTFSESLLSWHKLKRLELTDNPLFCSCQVQWLLELLKDRNFSQVQCLGPEQLREKFLKTLTPDELGCATQDTQQQAIIGALVVGSVALVTALVLLLYRFRGRFHEAFKDYKWNKRAISRKEHEYQKTFSDEEYMVRGIPQPNFPAAQLPHGQGPCPPVPVTEL